MCLKVKSAFAFALRLFASCLRGPHLCACRTRISMFSKSFNVKLSLCVLRRKPHWQKMTIARRSKGWLEEVVGARKSREEEEGVGRALRSSIASRSIFAATTPCFASPRTAGTAGR